MTGNSSEGSLILKLLMQPDEQIDPLGTLDRTLDVTLQKDVGSLGSAYYSNPTQGVKTDRMCYHQHGATDDAADMEQGTPMTTPRTPIDAFLATTRDVREDKRALVVQLCARGYRAAEVARLLEVSEAWVSTCRKRSMVDGVASFLLGYQGGTSFLSADERTEVLIWMTTHTHPTVRVLRIHRQTTFGVVYESRQRYDTLLKAAGLSHTPIQARNPKKPMRRSRRNVMN